MERNIFGIKNVDEIYYQKVLKDFLPGEIIDIHTHVFYDRFRAREREKHNVTWPSLVAKENPVEDLLETYRLMFPGKKVTPLIFGNLTSKEDDFEAGNAYIRECSNQYNLPALYFARPEEPAALLEEKLTTEGFLGVKVYLSLSPDHIPVNEITIFDYLPHHQLEVLDHHKAIAMLHIPGSGRLRDPVNLEQMLIIENKYPGVKLIIAHVGRAYCEGDLGDAFQRLSSTVHMMFDISANTNEQVFLQLIRAVGPGRILFGSDLPVTRMRMKRICENNRYINIVPPGLYGDISGDPHMREASREEGEKLSFFLYEEIAAFKKAAEAAQLTRQDIENVFYHNARRILWDY